MKSHPVTRPAPNQLCQVTTDEENGFFQKLTVTTPHATSRDTDVLISVETGELRTMEVTVRAQAWLDAEGVKVLKNMLRQLGKAD